MSLAASCLTNEMVSSGLLLISGRPVLFTGKVQEDSNRRAREPVEDRSDGRDNVIQHFLCDLVLLWKSFTFSIIRGGKNI